MTIPLHIENASLKRELFDLKREYAKLNAEYQWVLSQVVSEQDEFMDEFVAIRNDAMMGV